MTKLTLSTSFHSPNNSTPSIHNTFTQRDDVVEHLIGSIGASLNTSCLLQNLSDDRKVSLEMTTNSAGNIPKALENRRFELIGKCRTLID